MRSKLCNYICKRRLSFLLLIGSLIIIPDVIWTSALLEREKKLCVAEISDLLESCNYQETTLRMSRLTIDKIPGSVSMQAVDLHGLTAGQGAVKPVVYLYKRVIPDSLSTQQSSQLVDLIDNGAGKEDLGSKINEVLNHATVDAKDLDFAVFDSLFVNSLKDRGLYAPYSLGLKRLGDTLEIVRMKETPKYLHKATNVTVSCFLNSEKSVWYELDIRMGVILMSRLGVLLVTSLLLMIFTIILLISLNSSIKMQNILQTRKRDLIHIISHDLKTPVSNIGLSCEMLMQKAEEIRDDDSIGYSKIISRNCEKISGIVESIIPLSERIQTNSIEKGPVKLFPLVSKVVREACDDKKDVRTTIEIPKDCVILADESILEIIIRNLIDNAIKYSARSPEIVIRYKDDERNHPSICVSDNGIGIKNTDLPLVFKRYYRGDNSSSTRGFGLGLYTVKELVYILGWEISVKSTIGQGTTFTLSVLDS